MKLVIFLAVLQLAACIPHGPESSPSNAAPQANPSASTAAVPVQVVNGKTVTPAGCRKLPTDVDWPTMEQWKVALPEVQPRPPLRPGVTRPDYRLRAESYKDVQDAVNFCRNNNIRLSIINTGHDFVGRNDAPSGLLLDVSLLGGIQVHESFIPTAKGADRPNGKTNVITPAPGLRSMMVHPANMSGVENAKTFWKPYFDGMEKFPNMMKVISNYATFGSYKEYFDERFGPIDGDCVKNNGKRSELEPRHSPGMEMSVPQASGIGAHDSRLLGEEHFKHPNLSAAFRAAMPKSGGGILQGHLVSGCKVFRPDDDTSVLPAWRKTVVHVIGSRVPGISNIESLRAISPDSGAYVNEAYWGEKDWKTTFWGTNYPKLSQIKSKYDPDMLFWVSPGINADHMEANGTRVCKAAKVIDKISAPLTDNRNGIGIARGAAKGTLALGTPSKGSLVKGAVPPPSTSTVAAGVAPPAWTSGLGKDGEPLGLINPERAGGTRICPKEEASGMSHWTDIFLDVMVGTGEPTQ